MEAQLKRKMLTKEKRKKFRKKHKETIMFSEEEISKMIKQIRQFGKGGGFSLDYEKDGVTLESRIRKNGTLDLRSRSSLEFSSNLNDMKYLGDHDDMRASYDIPVVYDEVQMICVYEMKSPFPLLFSPRDFVYVRYSRDLGDGKFVLATKSVIFSGYPEKKKVVRGHIDHSMYYFHPHPKNKKKTLLYFSMNSDARGYLPKKIQNFVTKKMWPKKTAKMAEILNKYPEYLKGLENEEEGESSEESTEEEEEGSEEGEEEGEDED